MSRTSNLDIYSNVTLVDAFGNQHKVNLHNWTHLIITGEDTCILNFFKGPTLEISNDYYKDCLKYTETRVNLLYKFVQRIHGVVYEDHSFASIYEDTFFDPIKWKEPTITLSVHSPLKLHLALLEAKRMYKGYTL